jgi:hypothetical protein
LNSQDTFYGRGYQQTFVDTYRFHKTILQVFYQVMLRKHLYNVATLQKELDECLNTVRTHQEKMCCGRNPRHIQSEKHVVNF